MRTTSQQRFVYFIFAEGHILPNSKSIIPLVNFRTLAFYNYSSEKVSFCVSVNVYERRENIFDVI